MNLCVQLLDQLDLHPLLHAETARTLMLNIYS